MKVSKKELRRIAQMCLLNFSDNEYNFLKQSLEQAAEQAELIYQSDDFDVDYIFHEIKANETLIKG